MLLKMGGDYYPLNPPLDPPLSPGSPYNIIDTTALKYQEEMA